MADEGEDGLVLRERRAVDQPLEPGEHRRAVAQRIRSALPQRRRRRARDAESEDDRRRQRRDVPRESCHRGSLDQGLDRHPRLHPSNGAKCDASDRDFTRREGVTATLCSASCFTGPLRECKPARRGGTAAFVLPNAA